MQAREGEAAYWFLMHLEFLHGELAKLIADGGESLHGTWAQVDEQIAALRRTLNEISEAS